MDNVIGYVNISNPNIHKLALPYQTESQGSITITRQLALGNCQFGKDLIWSTSVPIYAQLFHNYSNYNNFF